MNKTPQIIATISTKNNEKTIYSCLKNANGQFDAIFVIDEDSSDETCYEINKFIRREHTKNIFVYDMSHEKVWPALPIDENIDSSRKMAKEFALVTRFASQIIWASIRPNVVLNSKARSIILNDMLMIPNLEIGHNFYKSSKNDICVSSMFLSGKLFPGPESGFKTFPCFYVKENNVIKKIAFNEKNYSNVIIGEKL